MSEYKYRLTSTTRPSLAKNLYRDDGDRYVRKCGAYILKRDMDHLGFAVTVDWGGVGLPPVGTVCVIHLPENVNKSSGDYPRFKEHDGQTVTVVALDSLECGTPVAVYKLPLGVHPGFEYHSLAARCFRPAPTPEQVERERVITEMVQVIDAYYDQPPGFAEQYSQLMGVLYDAGCRLIRT